TAIERFDDVFAVKPVDRGDGEQVGLCLFAHLVKGGERWTIDANAASRREGALRVDVVEADEFDRIGVRLGHALSPHARTAMAGADDRVTAALARSRPRKSRGARGQYRAAGHGAGAGNEGTASDGRRALVGSFVRGTV